MKKLFQEFYKDFSYLELEELINLFSVFGGVNIHGKWDYLSDFETSLVHNFTKNFKEFETLISPTYLLESPYSDLLKVIAKGEGKVLSSFRKAKLSSSVGYRILDELLALNVLRIEYSREAPLLIHPKYKLKKSDRSYQIQDKMRFSKPFFRFWFGFILNFQEELLKEEGDDFFKYFITYRERLSSLVYEQLSNELLKLTLKEKIISSGSYWNIKSEFDILIITQAKKIILGECKYKERKVCKNELNKLKAKALTSNIKVDSYALFSKNGFSKELLNLRDKNLLLFELEDFYGLVKH